MAVESKSREEQLAAYLRARRGELEQTALIRVHAIGEPILTVNAEYMMALRAAVCRAIEYGIEVVEHGSAGVPRIPLELLRQARLAASNEVSLDIVLRRYFTGHALFGDFVMQAATTRSLGVEDAHSVVRELAALFNHLVEAVTEEYEREAANQARSASDLRAQRVRRLLAGELTSTAEFSYDFNGWHLGAVALGSESRVALRGLAASLDCRLLVARARGPRMWVWFGRRKKLEVEDLAGAISTAWPDHVQLCVGEPSQGLVGWRLTHRQARAVVSIESQLRIIRYSDYALLTSMVQDDLLVESLKEIYLTPLATESDGGETLRETLRSYFAVEGNVSSAAAALGVSRKTVSKRLALAEGHLGRPLASCSADLQAALRLDAALHDGVVVGSGLYGASCNRSR